MDVNFDLWEYLKIIAVVVLALWIINHFARLHPATEPIAGGLS